MGPVAEYSDQEPKEGVSPRFWLLVGEDWVEVTKAEYVATERRAGFHNTLGQSDEPATASFFNFDKGLKGSTLSPDRKIGG